MSGVAGVAAAFVLRPLVSAFELVVVWAPVPELATSLSVHIASMAERALQRLAEERRGPNTDQQDKRDGDQMRFQRMLLPAPAYGSTTLTVTLHLTHAAVNGLRQPRTGEPIESM